MHPAFLLIVTAVVEIGAGSSLLVLPSVPLTLLLGVEQAAPESIVISRVAGAALLAIGVACGVGWQGDRCPAQLGLVIGALIYDTVVAMLLAYAALDLSLAGIVLWPAVVLHTVLAGWCVVCLWFKPRSKTCEQ